MTDKELVDLFKIRLAEVNKKCGKMNIALCMAAPKYFKKKRSYAFFAFDGSKIQGVPKGYSVIAFSEKFKSASRDRIDALMMHEFGHAMDYLAKKLPQIPKDRINDPAIYIRLGERRADALAEGMWGVKIYYDNELVQSLTHGQRPRPEFLGR